MLNAEELANLKAEILAAWLEIERVQYEVISPRSYKEKKGRRMELINPWKTLKERSEAEQKVVDLYWHYNDLQIKYWQEAGERVEIPVVYRAVQTLNGERWVKVESRPT